jgi:UDP-2,3-diacylglucosamine hydrolase
VAKHYRDESRERNRNKSEEIMDVNQDAVMAIMRQHGVYQLIHGHTHRPAIHPLTLNGHDARRIVLGDWYEQASILKCDSGKCRLESIPNR